MEICCLDPLPSTWGPGLEWDGDTRLWHYKGQVLSHNHSQVLLKHFPPRAQPPQLVSGDLRKVHILQSQALTKPKPITKSFSLWSLIRHTFKQAGKCNKPWPESSCLRRAMPFVFQGNGNACSALPVLEGTTLQRGQSAHKHFKFHPNLTAQFVLWFFHKFASIYHLRQYLWIFPILPQRKQLQNHCKFSSCLGILFSYPVFKIHYSLL